MRNYDLESNILKPCAVWRSCYALCIWNWSHRKSHLCLQLEFYSQLPSLYVTYNIQIARRTRSTVHCIHCMTARREPATVPAVFLRDCESKRGREISFFFFFFFLFLAKQTHWTQALLGAAINPESDLWKHICFHVNQMLRRLWARRKRLPQIPQVRWQGGKSGEKKIQITDKSNHIRLFLKCFPHTPLHRSDSRRPEVL